MNYQLLQKVIDKIKAEPQTYCQGTWTEDTGIIGSCGTRACIAGHICCEAVAAGLIPPLSFDGVTDIPKEARKLLNLTNNTCEWLFDAEFQPKMGIVKFLEFMRDHGVTKAAEELLKEGFNVDCLYIRYLLEDCEDIELLKRMQDRAVDPYFRSLLKRRIFNDL